MAGRRVAVVTGASSGMGRAAAVHLAAEGYRVFAATRFPDRLADVASKNLTPLLIDLRDDADVRAALESIERLDLLVNNAGYGLVGAVEYVDETLMREQFEVNVFGLLRVTRAAIPKMRENGGVIVNISSFLGKIGLPLLTFYNATKYAVEGITDSLRYELSPFHIRVHSILPGFFDTEFARSNLVKEPRTFESDSPYAVLASTLAPRIVEEINGGNDPEEVARLIAWIDQNPDAPARMTAGEKAKKFIPMRRELSDEDFERRVREYYGFA
ncbi:MAG: SDR family oxidoreductase [Epsilonproteobacteria bacterium]|nr:SDR family oxidoreductase [Campylobacterota bacterium]